MEINRADIVEEVSKEFHRYEIALVSNDVAMLGELFWDSPLTIRYGDGQSQYGSAEIAAFRQARPADDLRRELDRVVITTYGTDVATTAAEFHRTGSGRKGRQMQTWIRTATGWRVAAAYVSLLP